MIYSKTLIKMSRKWRKLTAISRKRLTFQRTKGDVDAESCKTSTIDKGHFVVYTADQRRFPIPLAYLNSDILKELLKMAEEEYGLPRDGPITLSCDSIFMEYAVYLMTRHAAKDLEKALLMSITTACCLSSSCLQQEQSTQQLLICSF